MQRVVSYRQGDRAEYLAQYILSAFAISVPVPRQEDVGSDFHCSLLRREANNLRPYLPFNIQIKSYSAKLLKEGVIFGGVTDAGNWRHHEIEQLCQTDTPFLVGLVNKDEQWIDVFSTISRHFVRVNWSGKGMPREVALMPYSPDGEGHLGAGEHVPLDEKPKMPNSVLKLPIGQPIVRVTIADSEDEDRCEQIKRILEPYLRLDQENAVLARLGLGYFEWPLIIRPGEPPREIGIGLACGLPGSPQFEKQRTALCKIISSILKSYQFGGMKEQIPPWAEVLKQLPLQQANPLIQQAVQDALAFAAEENP